MRNSEERKKATEFLSRVSQEYRTIDHEMQGNEKKHGPKMTKFLKIVDYILYVQEPDYFRYQNPNKTVGKNPDAVKVLYCFDGDTFSGVHNGVTKNFRLASVDTPEKGKLWAKEAKRILEKMIDNKVVYINNFGKDRYGRDVIDVFLDEKKKISVNNAIIKEGLSEFKDYSKINTFKSHNFFQIAHKNFLFLKALTLKAGRWGDKREEHAWRKNKF